MGMAFRAKLNESGRRVLVSLTENTRSRRVVSRLVFLAGLLVWIAVQGYFVSSAVHQKALPPEPSDALTYIVKTKQMEECPRQDCPAVQDLREQLALSSSTSGEIEERALVGSKIIPVYHPLLSAIFLGLTKFGMGLMEAHKWVWTAAPVFFGLSFAYLLWAIWGTAAAGLALMLLAFTVFPDTGLHHVVPSNLAMAIASIVYARIITRGGDAPWTLIVGSLVLVTMHPIGQLYTAIAVLMAVVLSGCRLRGRTWIALASAAAMIWLPRLLHWLTGIPGLVVDMPVLVHGNSWMALLREEMAGAAASALQVLVEMVRLQDSLFGNFALFFGAVMIGFIAAEPARRRIAARVTVLYFGFFVLALLVVSTHPADIALRMWVPLVVILHGAIGYGIANAWLKSLGILAAGKDQGGGDTRFAAESAWVLVLLAVLSGYACQRVLLGSEQILAMRQFVIDRMPLKLCPSQPALLMSESKPGDRVLYTSVVIMPYYFIHDAMRLGAVYYRPSLGASLMKAGWLSRPDLRFAVTYNPTVYHPEFQGVREIDWRITSPDFHFSPLNAPKTAQPLSREGLLRAADFRYIEIEPKGPQSAGPLRLHIRNFGKASWLEVIPVARDGDSLAAYAVKIPIKRKWTDWIYLDFGSLQGVKSFRLVFPTGGPRDYGIDGMVFGPHTGLSWPWNEKAALTCLPKDCCAGPIRVDFDPANLLPGPLRDRKIRVLDDCGSSVLLKLDE